MCGELNIGIIDNTISDEKSPIIHALGEIHHRAPKVSIRLHATQLDEIERGVVDGRFACGIVPVYQEKPEFDYHFLYHERSNLYCASSHKLFNEIDGEINAERIKCLPLVNHFYANHHQKHHYIAFSTSTTVAVQVEAVAMLILTGNYIGFLPEHYATHFMGGEKFKTLLKEEINISTNFSLVVKKGAALNSVLSLFLHCLLSANTSNRAH